MNAERTTSRSGTGASADPTTAPRGTGRLWLALLVVALIPLGWACEPREEGTLQEDEPAETSPMPGEEEQETLPGEEPMTEQEQRRTAEEATLGVETLEGVGEYVTDGTGRALYILEGGDDPSACADECAVEWPPFAATTAGEPGVEGGQLQEDRLGTVERPDGSMQVTYDGHPLYFYHDDQAPGDTQGQGVEDEWGHWYLLGPDGQPIEQPTSSGM